MNIDTRGLNNNEIDYIRNIREERRQLRQIEDYELGIDDEYLSRVRKESCECSGVENEERH